MLANPVKGLIEKNMMDGSVYFFANQEEVPEVLEYMLKACNSKVTGAEVLRLATKYTKQKIDSVSASRLMGQFRVLNIVFKSKSGSGTKLVNKNGNYKDVFAYVYNVDAPDLSELGYIYFEQRKNGTYHRIA